MIRILHVSDWHLGRTTYGHSRAEDHDAVLDEIIRVARNTRPHLIIHTGDVFDVFRPAYPELARAINAIQELAAVAPIAVLCGNHDSPALFRLFAQLLGNKSPIRFIDKARRPEDGGILEYPGPNGAILRLAPLPFVHANRIVDYMEDPARWTANYADGIHVVEDLLADGLTRGYSPSRDVLVFAAHLYVTGARLSRSERPLHVSDAYASRLERLPQVSYAAFGHIHRPQALPGSSPIGRYAGSPIALDFGEEGEKKEVVIVDVEPGRPAKVNPYPLTAGRPLARVTGTLEEIAGAAPSVGKALCEVTVKSEQPITNVSDKVATLLPEATVLRIVEDCAARRLTVLEGSGFPSSSEPSFSELFRDYLQEIGTKKAEADRVVKVFDALIRAVETEQEPSFPELVLIEQLAAARPA